MDGRRGTDEPKDRRRRRENESPSVRVRPPVRGRRKERGKSESAKKVVRKREQRPFHQWMDGWMDGWKEQVGKAPEKRKLLERTTTTNALSWPRRRREEGE